MMNLIEITKLEYGHYPISETFLRDRLEDAKKRKELICTQGLRDIGKTFQLIQYGKENDYLIVEPTEIKAKELRAKYEYDKIYGQNNSILRNQQVLVDEMVDVDELFKSMNCLILTGFIAKKQIQNKRIFTEEIVFNLKNEIVELNKSLSKCRQVDNFAMYKNLINGYRDVVRLIQDLDWKLMYSEYNSIEDEKEISQVSIWEQNGDGLIRNHKVWNVNQ